MYVKQADLLWGLDHHFVKEVTAAAEKVSGQSGEYLFREGDPARHFYTMLKGRIRLSIGTVGRVVHSVSHAGESFGWSSLVGRDAYSATAECMEISHLLRIETDNFNRIIEEDPKNGLRFMKRLSGMLGLRLMQSYRVMLSERDPDEVSSFGTGQIIETATVEP